MDLYEELGIQKVINAVGTYTVIGASKMSEETLRWMCEAARWNVEIEQLQEALGKRIAALTKNEAAYLCNSCSTALYLATAAFAARHYRRGFDVLSRQEVAQCEVVALWSQHIPYDHAIEQLGVKLRFIGYPNAEAALSPAVLQDAINENTIFCYFAARTPDGYYGEGCMNLSEYIATAHACGVPVLVDGAAQLPPKSNLWRYTEMGADIACFSGGKDLAGPQASGLAVGKALYIEEMRKVGFPHYSCGRLMKIGREEMVALYAAIRQYMQADEAARLAWCEREVRLLIDCLQRARHFTCVRTWPNQAGQPLPRAFVGIADQALLPSALRAQLMAGDPGIFCYSENKNGVYINPMCLADGQMQLIADRLLAIDAAL
jgi:L-seryl-tRNA(Ser) seleniumtransferase